MIRKKRFLAIVLFLTINLGLFAQNEARLLRFPDIFNEQAIFTYAGDLYTVNIKGGTARRLTSHPGFEMFAKYSPDGTHIAFTAQYDGNTEVYLIPSEGGIPQRLTYTATLDRDDVSDRMGPNNIVMGWTPDGKNIIFRSRQYSYNAFRGQLFTIPIQGGMPVELPIQDGGFCSYSENGKLLAFNKIFREFRTWKYYKGGMADDIWQYDFATKKAKRLFENPAQDIFPMYYKDEIYFASDRDRTMNLFSYKTTNKNITKITNYNKYDIKFPSIGGNKIIYENSGYLYYYDISTKKTAKIQVFINNDLITGRNKLVDATKYINSISLSPNGKFIAISARGEIFKVPSLKGVTKNLTNTPEAHDRNVIWSADGENIAYISDKSGEFEIYYQKADGSKPAVQLTKNADTYKFSIRWSPDGKKILWYDKKLRLRYIDIITKKITEVDKSNRWEITDFNWSPDSRWITYALPNYEKYNKIIIFDTKNKAKHIISNGWYPARIPNFSDDGNYLLFASSRNFSPSYDNLDWATIYQNMEKIYIVLLQKNTKNPLAAELSYSPYDTTTINNRKNVKIDFDKIQNRILALPIKASNYGNLQCVKNKIYYTRQKDGEKEKTIYFYDLKKQKEEKIATGYNFSILENGKKMLLVKEKSIYVVNLPTAEIKLPEKPTDLSALKYITDYQKEYKQIYAETWRQMRDFFYDPGMHGLNWDSIYAKYAILLPYVKNRNDLNYIIGEMIGEINIGHAYISGGERPEIEKIYTGLLGGRFSKDPTSGYFKIDKIIRGASWTNNRKSPLAAPGINVNEGQYIIAVNGIETKNYKNLFQLLINTAEKPTELLINSTASPSGAKSIVVVPLKSEADLYYYQWIQHNIDYVNKKTDGKVGYIHIPDMSSAGMSAFVEYFYPQLRKDGLIIDDRGNGGGNVSPIITEKLRRKMIFQKMFRNVSKAGTTPDKTHVGPKVLLLDEYSASDGDLFPYQFKNYKIGTLIGKRSWGGVVGIRGPKRTIDGGDLRKPEFAKFSADGKKWVIEGYGVDPDIEIDNNPADAINGKDAQLDKAIEVILEQIKNYDEKIVPNPPFPDKTKK